MFVYMCWEGGGGYNKTITIAVHDKFPYQAEKKYKGKLRVLDKIEKSHNMEL